MPYTNGPLCLIFVLALNEVHLGLITSKDTSNLSVKYPSLLLRLSFLELKFFIVEATPNRLLFTVRKMVT